MKKIEAIAHAKKYLVTNQETQNKEIMRAAGMLVFTQDTRAEPYKVSDFNTNCQEKLSKGGNYTDQNCRLFSPQIDGNTYQTSL